MRKTAIFFLILILVLATVPIPFVRAGWLEGWDKRVLITIDEGDIDAPLSNFPVLVYLSNSSGRNAEDVTFVFDEVGANSLKIAITESDGTTECKVEIEKWDFGNEKAWLWTKIPSVEAGEDTGFYFYFDNDHADNVANVGVVGSEAGESVWDANYLCVLHFSESSGNFMDSTSNDYDASAQGDSVIRGSELIDGGIDVAGSNDYARIETAGIDSNKDELTIQISVKGDAYGSDKAPVGDWAGGGNEVFLLYYDSFPGNKWRILFEDDGGGTRDVVFGAQPPIVGTWYNLAATYKRDDQVFGYQNGVQTAGDATADVQLESTTSKIAIGEERDGGAKDFNGHTDEFRLSDLARSPSWIKGTSETCFDDLLDYGEEEITITLPSVPNLLYGAGFNYSSSYVELHWNHSLENVEFFEIQNSSDAISWEYLGQSETTNYTDYEVNNGTARYYRVRACNQTEGTWYNSSFSHPDYERVYFEPVIGPETTVYENVTGEWVRYNLTEIVILVGVHDEGDVNSTLDIDGDTFNCSEIVAAPAYRISFNWTNIDPDAHCFWVVGYLYYDGTNNHVINIELWNFTSSSWVTLGHIEDMGGFEWVNVSIYDLRTPNDFISGSGKVRGRFDHVTNGNINDDIYIEFLKLNAFIPFESEVARAVESDAPWIALAIILSIIAFLLATRIKR